MASPRPGSPSSALVALVADMRYAVDLFPATYAPNEFEQHVLNNLILFGSDAGDGDLTAVVTWFNPRSDGDVVLEFRGTVDGSTLHDEEASHTEEMRGFNNAWCALRSGVDYADRPRRFWAERAFFVFMMYCSAQYKLYMETLWSQAGGREEYEQLDKETGNG